ncbi:MAG: protease inhibitor Inh/omp19 family protein [Pseudorhodoplanes sp.]|nr:protease inhibitor Inh/omp19 family protein [Pseudorhodoplanes sp.]
MVMRAGLILVVMLLLAANDRAFAQSDAVKAMAASGGWEISNADRDKTCTVTFKADPARTGHKLDLDPACGNVFPFINEVEGWTLSNDIVRLIDARGKTIFEFTEVESGMYEAERPAEGLFFLQNAAAAPTIRTPDQIAGEWVVMQGTKQICAMTLANTAVPNQEGALVLRIKPGCEPPAARLNFILWRMDQGEVVLASAGGQSWRFEEEDTLTFTWRRVPEGADDIRMVRK